MMTASTTNQFDSDPITALLEFDSELVIGLVGAVGTDLNRVGDILEKQLVRTGYQVRRVKVSREVITLFGPIEFDDQDNYDRISKFMTAGNDARSKADDDSILALGAAAIIAKSRECERTPSPRTAVIVNSLKRPEEVDALRKVYPSGFILLGVHAAEERRCHALMDQGISLEKAADLIRRDADENAVKHGQRLDKTFFLSDFFVQIDGNEDRLQGDLRRIVELLFGHPNRTPSFDEYAMFFAFAAALRSADLARQVGAVVAKDNQILATGSNDCPRAGGGLYWPERDDHGCWFDQPDGRDYCRGYDSNDEEQRKIIEKIVKLAEKAGLDPQILQKVLFEKPSPIRDLTEYGRVVHAEMDALMSCARSNLSTQDATLYCTTFPCHNCAKHLVAAGFERVVYIEPYEKSKAPDFHQDSIVFDSHLPTNGKVRFEPFVGIGPRRFFDLFSMNLSVGYPVKRKEPDGKIREWRHATARLRLQMLPSTYLDLEHQAAASFEKLITHEGNHNGSEKGDTPGT